VGGTNTHEGDLRSSLLSFRKESRLEIKNRIFALHPVKEVKTNETCNINARENRVLKYLYGTLKVNAHKTVFVKLDLP
jgi:hypothetical protein